MNDRTWSIEGVKEFKMIDTGIKAETIQIQRPVEVHTVPEPNSLIFALVASIFVGVFSFYKVNHKPVKRPAVEPQRTFIPNAQRR